MNNGTANTEIAAASLMSRHCELIFPAGITILLGCHRPLRRVEVLSRGRDKSGKNVTCEWNKLFQKKGALELPVDRMLGVRSVRTEPQQTEFCHVSTSWVFARLPSECSQFSPFQVASIIFADHNPAGGYAVAGRPRNRAYLRPHGARHHRGRQRSRHLHPEADRPLAGWTPAARKTRPPLPLRPDQRGHRRPAPRRLRQGSAGGHSALRIPAMTRFDADFTMTIVRRQSELLSYGD